MRLAKSATIALLDDSLTMLTEDAPEEASKDSPTPSTQSARVFHGPGRTMDPKPGSSETVDAAAEENEDPPEPEPPPWVKAIGKLERSIATSREQSEEICRMLDLPKPRKSALRQAVDIQAEIVTEAKEAKPAPIRTVLRCRR